MNDSPPKPPIHWTEDRVERLLLKVFGDAPGASHAIPVRRRSPWSHWALVATCAGLFALLAPVLMVSRHSDRIADRGDETAVSADDELIVAEATTSEDAEELSDDSESEGL